MLVLAKAGTQRFLQLDSRLRGSEEELSCYVSTKASSPDHAFPKYEAQRTSYS
jgi:hypothetical protein